MFSYKRIPSVEQELGEESFVAASLKTENKASRNIKTKTMTWIWLLKDIVLVLLALHGLWSVYAIREDVIKEHRQKEDALRSCNCGSSVAEALSRGCKYDSLAAGWLPDHCRDDELLAEFEQAGDGPDGQWTYWLDRNHTTVITPDELALKGDDPDFRFHMSIEWHRVHCIFYWRKEHRARFNGKLVEKRSDSEAHIKHCGMILQGMTGSGTVAGVELNMDDAEE